MLHLVGKMRGAAANPSKALKTGQDLQLLNDSRLTLLVVLLV